MLLVLTNLPDMDSAEAIAKALIEGHHAACVNIMSPCTSVYRWKGQVETASEIPVLIKTTEQAYPAVEQVVRKLHPYELPEIVAVSIVGGLPDYLAWIATETGQTI